MTSCLGGVPACSGTKEKKFTKGVSKMGRDGSHDPQKSEVAFLRDRRKRVAEGTKAQAPEGIIDADDVPDDKWTATHEKELQFQEEKTSKRTSAITTTITTTTTATTTTTTITKQFTHHHSRSRLHLDLSKNILVHAII